MKSEASTAGRGRPSGSGGPPQGGGGQRGPGTRKQDWIAQHLRQVYDDALNEEIPQEMLDLLNSLDEDRDQEQGNRG